MITYEMIKTSVDSLHEIWGEDGEKVVATCAQCPPLNITFAQFLDYCIVCGGNWGGMLLTGLKKLCPRVWDAIPDNMGPRAVLGIAATLILCGVDTSE